MMPNTALPTVFCLLLLLLLLIPLVSTLSSSRALVADRCPRNWRHFRKTKSCYHVSHKKLNHFEAQSYCGRLSPKSTLLRIEDQHENKYISELNKEWPMWIDAKARFDIVDSAAGLFSPGYVLRWPNNRPVRYSNFAQGNSLRRLTAKNGCVTVNGKGEWINAACSSKAYAICEQRPISQPVKVYIRGLIGTAGCAKNWHHNRATKSCYRAVTRENLTMLTADIKCYEMGAEMDKDAMLTSVSGAGENEFLLNLARNTLTDFEFILLGAFGNANDRQNWAWLDGSDFSIYQNWERGMPHGGRSLAVLVMNRRGRWINHYADKILSFYKAVAICKYKV